MLRRPVVVRARPGLLGTVARTAVVAGTATATANAVTNRQSRRQQAAPVPAAGQGGQDITAELKQLADMKAAGILTDEEFTAAKAKILG
jgi:hypothetical protein